MLRSLVLCLALCARALGFCVGSGPPRLHVPKRHRLAAQAMLPPDAPPVQRWFDGVEDEAAIKRRFKELAVKLHPDANLDDAEAEVAREAGHAVDDEALVAAPHGDAHLRGRSLGRARARRRGPRGDARRRGRSSSAPSCSASGAGTRRAR